MGRRLLVIPVAFVFSMMSAGCAIPREALGQLPGNPASRPSLAEVQLSPPAEILPVETQLPEDAQQGVDGGQDSELPALAQPQASLTGTSTPTITWTSPPGTQPLTATFTITPGSSPTATPTSTATATLPAGTQPLIPSATRTATVAVVFTPTSTNTTTPTQMQQGSPPPPPTATNTPQPTVPPACDPAGNGSFESALIALINQERQGRGIGALSPQGQLATAAREHSADMACNGFFSHTGSDGTLPWDRVSALGYSYSAIAENIFAGSSNAQTAFNAWMNSPGHRDNMLNPAYSEIGVGYRYWADSPYGAYTTAVFASPR